jgi:hypothetical protein
MKRLIVATILVGALMALVAGTALAAGPTTPPWQGSDPATGVQAVTPPCGAEVGSMPRRGAPEWAGDQEAVAKLLGMTEEAIQTERLAGKSLAQIAAAKYVSEDALVNAMLSARKDALAKLVADDKLTQAQADLMVENMTSRVKTMVERSDVGPAFGQGGTRGMMGQGMRGGRWNRS